MLVLMVISSDGRLPGHCMQYNRKLQSPSHRLARALYKQVLKSSRQAQSFLSSHSFIYGHFRPRRHKLAASAYRQIRSEAFKTCHQETCAKLAA
jgi:putative transposase